MVDVLGAVVGVEASDGEGESQEQTLQDGEQEALADAQGGGDELKRGHLIEVGRFEALKFTIMLR